VPLLSTGRGQQQSGGPAVKVNQAFALIILAALLILIALRHLFGSIRVEVGAH
jgi:hypothetical protein